MDRKDLFALIHNTDDKELYAILLDLNGCMTNNSEAVKSQPDQSATTTIINTNVGRSSAEVYRQEPPTVSHSTSRPLRHRYNGFKKSAWRRIKKPARSFKGSGRHLGKSRFFLEASQLDDMDLTIPTYEPVSDSELVTPPIECSLRENNLDVPPVLAEEASLLSGNYVDNTLSEVVVNNGLPCQVDPLMVFSNCQEQDWDLFSNSQEQNWDLFSNWFESYYMPLPPESIS